MSDQVTNLRTHWDEHGYILVRGLFDGNQVADLRRVCDVVLSRFLEHNPQTDEPGNPDGRVMRHLNHTAYFADDPEGFHTLMSAVADPRIREVVAAILGEPPLFRCTSYWYNPIRVGRDGNWHRDCQFTYPDEADQRRLMAEVTPQQSVQLMLALAPTEDNEYIPGSHLRWDTDEEYAIRWANDRSNSESDHMPGAVRLPQEPGAIMAFHPYGLHRGRYHTDKLRRTLMLTYTVEASAREDYFTLQPWCLEPGYLDGLEPHTRAFFQRFKNRFEAYWKRESA